MSIGWSLWVIVLILMNVGGCAWLLYANRSVQIDPQEKGKSTGHEFDGIEELNNPLPGMLTFVPEHVKITVDIEKYTEAVLEIPVDVSNIKVNLRTFPSKVKVLIITF